MTHPQDIGLRAVADFFIKRYGPAPMAYKAEVENAAKLYLSLSRARNESDAASLYLSCLKQPQNTPAVHQNKLKKGLGDDCLTWLPGVNSCLSHSQPGEKTAFIRIMGELSFRNISGIVEKIEEATDVEFVIDSRGGNCADSLSLIQSMAGRKSVATVTGKAWSAAAVLLQGCQVRRLYPSASLMIHPVVLAVMGDQKDLMDAVISLQDAEDAILPIFHRSKTDDVRRWFAGGDHYFSAEEAVKAGLADEIVPEPKPFMQHGYAASAGG